jgi:hypothetical protein
MSAFGGRAGVAKTGAMSPNDPKRTSGARVFAVGPPPRSAELEDALGVVGKE